MRHLGPGSHEPDEDRFPPVPSGWLAASKSLRAPGYTGEQRVKRAWVAGCWVREVLAGRAQTPKPTPRLTLTNRFYPVARSANGSPPEICRSYHDYLIAAGNLQHNTTLSQAFPSELECKVYLEAAGLSVFLLGLSRILRQSCLLREALSSSSSWTPVLTHCWRNACPPLVPAIVC